MTNRSTTRRALAAVLALSSLSTLIASCSSGTHTAGEATRPRSAVERGRLVTDDPVLQLTAAAVRSQLRKDGYDPAQVRFGVTGYRVTYRTVGTNGKPTTATGLVVLPRNSRSALQPVEYLHGTVSAAQEAPSVDDGGRSDEALLFGSAGYAAIAPDELGLGRGTGAHPYLQLATEASAGVDMLPAADAAARSRHRTLAHGVLVTGFSQGGQAAMGVSRSLASGAETPWRLRATAAVSGPYELRSAEIPAALDGSLDQRDAVFYLAYLLTSWNALYHLYDAPGDIFRKPYDHVVPALFDGRHTEMQIFPQLPATPARLLTPAGEALLRHPTGPLAAALRANDVSCTGWSAHAPVRLYASSRDEQVTAANTRVCQRRLAAAGVRSTVIDVGRLQHFPSERVGLRRALGWFLGAYPPATA